ncbi:MAG: hypothetical protein AAF376_03910 [Pseudomonadota bacterium]
MAQIDKLGTSLSPDTRAGTRPLTATGVLSTAVFVGALTLSTISPAQADPLPSGSYTFNIISVDPDPTDGADCSGPTDTDCAHILQDLTVNGITFTQFTTPSDFEVNGFATAGNIQSRIYGQAGEFVFGRDATYEADMLANVFSDTDLNRYQQVDNTNGVPGFFEFTYPVPVPATSDFFFLITERFGNNTQFVEAFDDNGVSMGTVRIDAGRNGPDYSDTGRRLLNQSSQNAFIAVIALNEYFDASDPTRRIRSFQVSNTPGANDGGDHKAFVFGSAVPPNAVDDESLDNTPGSVVRVQTLSNDEPIGSLDPATVQIAGTSGPGQPLTVNGQGTWSVDTSTGDILFTPVSGFLGNPDPISYTVLDTNTLQSNAATITVAYSADPPVATNDSQLDLAPGTVASVNVLANDEDADGLQPAPADVTVDLDPTTPGIQTTLTAPNEGEWSYNTTTGAVTFTPLPSFAGDPAAITYELTETATGLTDTASITVTYDHMPALELVKSVAGVADTNANGVLGDAGDTVTYNFTVENTGNTSLAGITISDPLLSATPLAVSPADLAPGATATLTGQTLTITPAQIAAGQVENTATTAGQPVATGPGGAPDPTTPLTDAGGNPLPNATDTSDTGSEPQVAADGTPTPVNNPGTTDTNGTPGDDDNEPTLLSVPVAAPGLEVVKSVGSVTDTNGNGVLGDAGDTVTYDFMVTNTGNTSLAGVEINDPLLSAVPLAVSPADLAPGGVATLTGQALTITPAQIAAGVVENTATASGTPVATGPGGVPDPSGFLVAPGGGPLPPVTDTSDTGTEPQTAADGTPIPVSNPGSTDTNGTPGDDGSEPTLLSVPLVPPGGPGQAVTIAKTTPSDVVSRGVPVPYTITLTNGNSFPIGPVSIRDTLPEGLFFVPGSGTLNGAAVVPDVDGNVVTFGNVNLAAGETVTVTLVARILNGANPGLFVNSALALDPTGLLLAGPATATIRVLPEPFFDCGTVVGRVFDDLDADGYQDSFEIEDRDRDGNDDVARPSANTGSVRRPNEALAQERGLPGVRLVTLDGLIITTDQNGLFNVPCAALPADRGTNFLLSLDERTLPTGFEMTTENPRVMRLTPGVLTEMNFGARLANLMRVDLNQTAFPQGPQISEQLRTGIAAMVARLVEEPANVELIFHLPADAGRDQVAAARAAMDAVEAEISRQWRSSGDGRLTVEQTIARAVQ